MSDVSFLVSGTPIRRMLPVVLAWLVFGSQPVIAEPIRSQTGEPTLPICTGLAADGVVAPIALSRSVPATIVCPPASAIVAHKSVTAPMYLPVASAPLDVSCCPVPVDALTDDVQWVEDVCPEGYVGTGARGIDAQSRFDRLRSAKGVRLKFLLRCSRINEQVYALGTPTDGWTLGPDADPLPTFFAVPFGHARSRTLRSRIPVGLRYGILRSSMTAWPLTRADQQQRRPLMQPLPIFM